METQMTRIEIRALLKKLEILCEPFITVPAWAFLLDSLYKHPH